MNVCKPYENKSWEEGTTWSDTITLHELADRICVSRDWIYRILLPDIENVCYRIHVNESIGQVDSRDICFNADEIAEWFLENGIYTRQQTTGDLCSITGMTLDQLETLISEGKERLREEKHLTDTQVFRIKWYDLEEFEPYERYFPGNSRKRSEYPPVKVEPVDIFNGGYKLVPANQSRHQTKELLYREMFDQAAIKVTLGNKARKTMFLVPVNNNGVFPICYPETLI